ncbi:MAG: ABC transporter ATP-binding protein [Alphaproteobacteria bacterium]|nr:ABC transporter ATP-binding protein [Alphaproteobacteria bacterium]
MAVVPQTDINHATPRLDLRAVSKAFPGVQANDAIDLAIMPGEIHALLGENGAGKSTLVKIISGVLHADSGAILWEGEPILIPSPKAARTLGIGMVFQHFSLFEALTVAENIELGMDNPGDRRTLPTRISEMAERYGLALDPHRHVHMLSVGEKQRIEIIRALLLNPRLLIMDEPTSVLTPQEAETLFGTLRQLADEGVSILFISHKLAEIKALCHTATILRAGKVVAVCDPAAESPRSMAELMIGERLTPPERNASDLVGADRLVIENLSADAQDQFGVTLHKINLAVRAGEIVGIAGVSGNGQTELMALLTGEILAPRPEMIRIDGRPVGRLGPNGRRDMTTAFVPEERMGHAAVEEMSLTDNALLTSHRRKGFVSKGFISRLMSQSYAQAVCDVFRVKHRGVRHEARHLSGGNMQKFVIGREIEYAPGLLIANQPTWGVDTGAAASIQQALIDLSRTGSAVVVISQDLDELLSIADRICVLHNGRLSQTRPTADYTIEEIGLAMTGHDGEDATSEEIVA